MSAITALRRNRCPTVAQTAAKRTIRTGLPSARQPKKRCRIFCGLGMRSRNKPTDCLLWYPRRAVFISVTNYTPVSLSHCHLLLDLFRHINQAKSVEHSINVRHTPDVSQILGSAHHLSDFTDIVIRQDYGAPSKALAVLSAVDPQFLGELISPALLQPIGKGQAGQSLELVAPKSHRALPEVLFAWVLFQRHHHSIVSLPLCTGLIFAASASSGKYTPFSYGR